MNRDGQSQLQHVAHDGQDRTAAGERRHAAPMRRPRHDAPRGDMFLSDDLLQHLATAVLVLDARLCVRTLNQAAEILLQVSGQRCVGEPATSVLVAGGSSIEPMAAPLLRAQASGSSITLRATWLRRSSGGDITVDLTITPLTELGGGVIVEISPLEPAIQIRRDETQASVQESARLLLRGLAHEIKNPLGGVRGAAQLLAGELPTPQLREYTKIIIDEADRLRDLVDRLLAPRPRMRYLKTNIHHAVERVIQLIHAETPDVHIDRDYDPSVPDLQADEGQLIQAVLNVLRNAQQALTENRTDPAGASGRVGDSSGPRILVRTRVIRQATIGLRRLRLALRLELIDNGPGIPEAIADKLFFPMISGRASGTGLGLSITQAIIAQHHGTIECSSRPGHTRFSITLPLEQPDER